MTDLGIIELDASKTIETNGSTSNAKVTPEKPLFAKRTSSLSQPKSTNGHTTPKKVTLMGSLLNNILGEEEQDSSDELTKFGDNEQQETDGRANSRKSAAEMQLFIEQQESILNELDSASHKLTLQMLEQENAKLQMNPRSILAEAGNYRTATATLSGLTEEKASKDDDLVFWNSIIEDYSGTLHKIPQLIQTKVRAGIPTNLRPKIWMLMCDANPERVKLLYPNLINEDSSFDRIIKRDIPRTFPKVEMFKDPDGDGQKMLYNLLKAYSVYDTELGYCQGLSFVVGPLLMQKVTESDAFSILIRLMEETTYQRKTKALYGMRSLFTPQMHGLHLLLFQHSQLVKVLMPKLSEHFEAHNITSSMYASQWFLTIFAYNFPFPLVFRIFDIIFSEGAMCTILKFSVAVLRHNQEKLCSMVEFEEILNYLKDSSLFASYGDHELAVKDAMSLSDVITDDALERLKRQFEDEHSTTELSSMRELVTQLRSESVKMFSTLNEVNARNGELEKENSTFNVFRKGAEIEIETLKTEVLSLRKNVESLNTENQRLKLEISELRESGDLGAM